MNNSFLSVILGSQASTGRSASLFTKNHQEKSKARSSSECGNSLTAKNISISPKSKMKNRVMAAYKMGQFFNSKIKNVNYYIFCRVERVSKKKEKVSKEKQAIQTIKEKIKQNNNQNKLNQKNAIKKQAILRLTQSLQIIFQKKYSKKFLEETFESLKLLKNKTESLEKIFTVFADLNTRLKNQAMKQLKERQKYSMRMQIGIQSATRVTEGVRKRSLSKSLQKIKSVSPVVKHKYPGSPVSLLKEMQKCSQFISQFQTDSRKKQKNLDLQKTVKNKPLELYKSMKEMKETQYKFSIEKQLSIKEVQSEQIFQKVPKINSEVPINECRPLVINFVTSKNKVSNQIYTRNFIEEQFELPKKSKEAPSKALLSHPDILPFEVNDLSDNYTREHNKSIDRTGTQIMFKQTQRKFSLNPQLTDSKSVEISPQFGSRRRASNPLNFSKINTVSSKDQVGLNTSENRQLQLSQRFTTLNTEIRTPLKKLSQIMENIETKRQNQSMQSSSTITNSKRKTNRKKSSSNSLKDLTPSAKVGAIANKYLAKKCLPQSKSSYNLKRLSKGIDVHLWEKEKQNQGKVQKKVQKNGPKTTPFVCAQKKNSFQTDKNKSLRKLKKTQSTQNTANKMRIQIQKIISKRVAR